MSVSVWSLITLVGSALAGCTTAAAAEDARRNNVRSDNMVEKQRDMVQSAKQIRSEKNV